MGNQKLTIQRNWQHKVHKTKKSKTQHNTIYVGHHYAQINTTNVNKTCALLLTTGGNNEPNIVVCGIRYLGNQYIVGIFL